jgi:hypothetical protein
MVTIKINMFWDVTPCLRLEILYLLVVSGFSTILRKQCYCYLLCVYNSDQAAG